MNLPPIRMYAFGTVERWKKAIVKAIEEDVILGGTMQTTIGKDGVRTKAQALGTSGYNWYEVEVVRSGESTFVGCRCRAGENAIPCKHIARVFLHKRWLPWPEGVTPKPQPAMQEFVEEDLFLSVIKGVSDDEDGFRADAGTVSGSTATLPEQGG